MNDPRTLSYADIDALCQTLEDRLKGYDALKADYDFYRGLRDNFDKIAADLGVRKSSAKEDSAPDLKTKKGVTYFIVCQHPEGITQEQIIAESAKYGEPLKPGTVSSLLSQLKNQKLIKKRKKLFMPNK